MHCCAQRSTQTYGRRIASISFLRRQTNEILSTYKFHPLQHNWLIQFCVLRSHRTRDPSMSNRRLVICQPVGPNAVFHHSKVEFQVVDLKIASQHSLQRYEYHTSVPAQVPAINNSRWCNKSSVSPLDFVQTVKIKLSYLSFLHTTIPKAHRQIRRTVMFSKIFSLLCMAAESSSKS